MARRRAARGSPRGGEVIQALRARGTRLTTALASLLVLGGVGLYAGLSGRTLADVGGGLAAFGCVLLLVALALRLQVLVPWAVLFAGSGYVVARLHHHVADGWAAVVGAALLFSAELAAWSIADDTRIHTERAVTIRRGVYSACLVAASALAGFVLVGATAVALTTGVLLTAVGVAAAVASIGLVLRLVRPPSG